MKIKKQILLNPTQLELINSKCDETLASGGVRAGKTIALCCALVEQASIPNNTVYLIRKVLTDLKDTTLQTLIGGQNPILPLGYYKLDKQTMTISIPGGGRILCRCCDDFGRFGGAEAGAIFIDEASQISLEDYKFLLTRLSSHIGNRQMYLATNPSGPRHWIYKRFYEEKSLNRKVITMRSQDNEFLPDGYIEKTVGALDLNSVKRLTEGLWITAEGLVFEQFDRNIHVKKLPLNGYEEYYLGLDWGQTHPAGMLLIGKRRDRIYVLKENCRKNMLIDDIKKYVKSIKDEYPMVRIVYDPSAPLLANELGNMGITLKKAENEVNIGIGRIRSKLAVRNDGPDLIINDTCIKLIEELETYQYQENSDKVKKVNDDLTDCLRYCVNEIDNVSQSYTGTEILDI